VRRPLRRRLLGHLGAAVPGDQRQELIVGKRTRLSDLGLDVPRVLAAAGEAAVSGIVRQAIADAADGVCGALNNLLFDHATVRPRRVRDALDG